MTFKAFDRTVSFAPGSADTKWIEAELAIFARAALAEVQRSGEGSELYVKAVNGRRNAAEEQVIAPGAIVYTFDWVRQAALRTLEAARLSAPKRSGRYARSFIAIANGREVPAAGIGLGASVLIVNTQPYSRKIQVGSRGFESYRGQLDAVRRRVASEFRGLVKMRTTFVQLSNAYRLKFGSGRRKDRRAGAEINYPAIEIVSETVVLN